MEQQLEVHTNMPNRHTTLTSLFTDIAGAIRSKTGDSAVIKADDFDTAIEAIQTGGGVGGEFTTEQILGIDPIDSLSYDGTTLPDYSLNRKKINNLSLPNLTTINNSSLGYTNTSSDLNTLFSKLERIYSSGLYHFNDEIKLTSDYNVAFPKLTYITESSIQYFGGGGSSDYTYANYNKPKYNIIMPLITSSRVFPGYYAYKIRNFSARN